MTWNETHARTAIFREVEAAAAADMSGALPWREEWAQYFGCPENLVKALRARWNHMVEAQLDIRTGEDALQDAYQQLRRSQAGILAILKKASETPIEAGAKVYALTGASRVITPAKGRVHRFWVGPVLR
ncbi:hypothetical protein F0U44_07520 [Nocardioides humilatus]|uniref:Uncharacterized protein n=1 Tax=Nocardioides humilatus TaxID=2607660 RepID=A0A5B1LKV8_9ACTN|nr:hypothetical protein [Nocardioides humilatus]KAA1420257.1 hypothetical protein F0U44_07520 [Nocardioides humilatus]